MPITPTVGRIVHYRLSENDVRRIDEKRAADTRPSYSRDTGGAVREGDVVPLVIVRVWPYEHVAFVSLTDSKGVTWPFDGTDGINGQALLDGNDSLWVCSAGEGDGPGQWRWPTRLGGTA